MKVALISEHASPLAMLGGVDSGGQNVYVGQVALHLARMGHAVDVFTRRDNSELPEIYDWEPGVRIIHVPAGPAGFVSKEKLLDFMQDFSSYMMSFCRLESYDIIHANFWMSGTVGLNIKAALGIPLVITFHALGKIRRIFQKEADGFPEERMAIEEQIVQEADCIFAECPQEKYDLMEMYGTEEGKIVVIPCGFDPAEFQPIHKDIARRQLGLSLNDTFILQLGRMVPRKGVDTVIEALKILSGEFKIPPKLLIVGGNSDEPDPQVTPEIGRLMSIARQSGISDRVIFTGRKPRSLLKFYYNAADVFVTTPWYEPFGITPLESMACGTPVIGSNVGGIKFSVKDKETGFLVPAKDPYTLADRMTVLLGDRKMAESFRVNCIKRARQFVWSNIAVTVDSAYKKVCAYVCSDRFSG